MSVRRTRRSLSSEAASAGAQQEDETAQVNTQVQEEQLEAATTERSTPKKKTTKKGSGTIIASQNVVPLKNLTYSELDACENRLRALNASNPEVLPILTWISDGNQFLIDQKFKTSGKDKGEWEDWRQKDYLEWLLPELKLLYPANTWNVTGTPAERIAELKAFFQKLCLLDEETFNKCILKMREIFKSPAAIALDSSERRTLINKMYEQMYDKNAPAERQNLPLKRLYEIMKEDKHPDTFEEVYDVFSEAYAANRAMVISVMKLYKLTKDQILVNMYKPKNNNHGTNNNHKNGKRNISSTVSVPEGPEEPKTCNVCGRIHGKVCLLIDHPDRNQENVPWGESKKGKLWAEKNIPSLPWKTTLSGKGWNHPPIPEKNDGNKKPRLAGKDTEIEVLNTLLEKQNTDTLTVILQASKDSPCREAQALVDTGALHANYMSVEMAACLKKDKAIVSNSNSSVCDAFGICSKSVGNINIMLTINKQRTVEFKNTPVVTNKCECSQHDTQEIYITCTIIESPYDLIIGRPTIVQYNLLETLKYHLTKCRTSVDSTPVTQQEPPVTQLAAIYQKRQDEQRYIRESMRKYIDYDSDTEGIEIHTSEEDPYDIDQPTQEDQIPTEIHGSETLKQQLTQLCAEYKDIFSTQLRPTPAKIPAYEIQCDIEKWHVNKNRVPARVQSHAKQAETIRQVTEMLKNNVIRKSQASSYSQVLLTPKPNNKWRFCIDYRNLNATCAKQGWPIPNIKLMIQRIGQTVPKSKIFGKIDLTSGYHQAPLSQSSAFLTAFITIIGVFEWLRVPMGLGGAPSYFQQVMATVVLVNLLNVICELYIDDIFIHAATEEEFITRVRQVFERFRKHKITVNPNKCILGKDEIEFVGHLINKDGITFTRERLDSVLQIPLPTHERGLKKFIGIVNYFHDHIRDHSVIVKPLQLILHNYVPTRKITWNTEAIQAFEKIKEKINECPTLSFMDPQAPVYLHTDACDYGMGSYLFQLIDGIEIPIAFMSRAFNERETRWSTPEKECYAIYYSLVKFEYLLRDIYFVIRTDHRNLTYLNNSANEKVNRWKIKIQHYNFDIEYIPGPDNFVADAFSRLVSFDSPNVKNLDEQEQLCLLDEFKLEPSIYKKISSVHSTKAGHFGVERTMQKLHKKGENWEYMRQHVRKFIKQCPCCQKMSVLKVCIHTHPFTTATYEPMERVNIDTIGPFEPDDNKNTYMITIIDCFTRWVEIYPCKDATAVTAANALLQHIGRYGVPHQILSDNGSQYVNELISEFTKLVGTEHVRTLAYSKQENAIVERVQKESLRHLRAIVFDENIAHRWSTCIPFIQRIINSSTESSIGTSPATLLYGNSIDLDKGIFLPLNDLHDTPTKLSAWADGNLAAQQAVLKVAQKNQLAKDNKHILSGNTEQTQFEDGSYVLVEYPANSVKKGPPNKLNTYLRGPLRVESHRGATYRLRNLVTNKIENVHVSLMRIFHFDEQNLNPIDVANRDAFATVVEEIVAHSPVLNSYTGTKRSELEFKVRWLNLGKEYDRYLPYKELRNNPRLHDYLRANNMKAFIPPEHK